MLVSCVILRLSVSRVVCSFVPCSSQFKAIFTKLHTQLGTSPRKNCLDFQGHGIKGQGHAGKFGSPPTMIDLACFSSP